MRRFFLVILLVLFYSFLFSDWIEIDANQQKLFECRVSNFEQTEVAFSLDGYEMESIERNGKTYQRISYANEGEFIDVGKPDLPCFSRLVAIPNQGEVSVEVTSLEKEIISDITIYPRQPLKIDGELNNFPFTIDNDFYSGTEIFPATITEIGEPAIMRDFRVVRVTVNPFQYDPQKNELSIFSNVTLQVHTQGTGGVNCKLDTKPESSIFTPLYKSSIINYEEVRLRNDEFIPPTILFIYPSSLNPQTSWLDSLVLWKHRKGFDVVLASTAETGTSMYNIKSYIQDAYDNWDNRPDFVCLVGDASGSYSIPTGYAGYGEGDQVYTRLDGTDILADVWIGRLSFNSVFELQTIVYKILHYEREPYLANTNWYERALLVGDPSHSGQTTISTSKSIKEAIIEHNDNFIFDEVYGSPFVSQMTTSFNTGVSFMNYRGYIGMSGWYNSNTLSLNNGFMLPLALFLTCSTGSFASGDARSEVFLRAGQPGTPKGAIGAVGTATSGTHTSFNNSVCGGTYFGIFAEGIYYMGGALNRGKINLYNNFSGGNLSGYIENFSYWNNLMGDPSLELWTGVPKPINVSYETNVSLGANFLEIFVTHEFGTPLEGAWVTILKGDDEIFETGLTDADGMIILPINTLNTGEASVTVTKHNYIPHLGSFNIEIMNQFVNIFNVTIDDDNTGTSSGNGDGNINPGEDIELVVSLKNFGTNSVAGVSATLSSDDVDVTITDDTEDYGSILAGATANPSDDFDFSVSTSALGSSEIEFDLLIEDSFGNSWTDKIYLTVFGIYFDFTDYAIIGGNNQLDPGETAQMTVTLENIGSITAFGIYGTLISNEEAIEIDDAEGYLGTILSNNSGTNNINTFQVTANTQIIPGSQFTLSLELFNASGFSQTLSFIIEVGEVSVTDPLGADSYGYYCYDDEDINYFQAPMYNWIEIDPTYGGSGTILPMNDNGNNGDIEIVNLPFTLRFYGMIYNQISVCSNGFISPGITEEFSYMNWTIPGPLGPSPVIAPFWDDLMMSNGKVCYYYDSAEHYFIVEWSRVKNQGNSSYEETFEIILYDISYYPSSTGDNDILFQYHTFNNVDVGSYPYSYGQYSTVGLEDHTGLIGLEYTFNNQYPTAAKPLEDEMAILFTTNGSEILEPPVLVLNPSNFQFILMPNQTDVQTLDIINDGEANLIYSITKQYVDPRNTGGPDDYGYIWTDNNEVNGPVYSWRDISGIGTEVTFIHNDQGTALMPIGFDFLFYGTIYDEFRINPNGWIGFGDDNTEWNNLSLPHPDAPKPAIMPFWDDLDPLSGGNVYFYSTSDSLVVWFDDVIHFAGNYTGTYDFQFIIYSTGSFLFQYREVSGDIDSATIGIQNEDASDALQVVYNGNCVENEYAIYFIRIIDWLDISPTFGFVESGQTETVILNVSTEELFAGDYLCNLKISTNDPEANLVTIPVDLTVVSQMPEIVVSADSLDFGVVYIGNDSTLVLAVSNQGSDPLVVSNISYDADEFTVDITNFILQPAQSQNVNITFTPISDELISGILSIDSNDPNNPIVEVSLSGQGFVPGVPNIDISADSLDFGIVIVGTDSLKTLTISNNGDTSLFVTEIYTNTEEYSVDLTSFDLGPDEFQNLSITFAPSYEGTILDTLTILSNDPDEPIIEVPLSGEGFIPVPVIVVSADSLDFGVVIIGSDSLNTLTVTNTGTITLSVTDIYTNTDEYLVNLTEFSLEPEENQVLEITFAPGYEGMILDTLFIDSNDPIKPVYPVSLQGEGAPLVNSGDGDIPLITALGKNYPNPFNPQTTINFALHEPVFTRIEIFNIKGQKIKTLINEPLEARNYQIVWNGTDDNESSVASGIYLYRMSADKFSETRKMLLVK